MKYLNIPHPRPKPPLPTPTYLAMSKIFDMNGRIALVTGGGTGIGWHIASGLAENGAKVYITGRRKDVLEKAAVAFTEQHRGNGSIIP